ncbi:MAG TPA: alpha/beta fold hydrolase [Rhodocyclaceae bacterium]|nr:alpha/beta fold hydrolase [Rhodocyclaceae bacterium]
MANAPVTLYCLPCAGASATMYMRWRRLLPEWVRVEPLELPGRGVRLTEDPQRDYAQLVAFLVRDFSPSGPYAFFGHSMGALLAYGMTREILRAGCAAPVSLLLSGSAAPTCQDKARYANRDNKTSLVEDMRRQGGTPDAVFENEELLDMTVALLAADYSVCASFACEAAEPLPMPIHVFGGNGDEIRAPRILAWGEAGSAGFTADWFEGGHFFLRQQEGAFLAVLARRLGEDCAGREAGGAPRAVA